MSQQAKNLIAQARTEGWKRLDLGNCNLTDLQTQVPELFELEQLEELVLSNDWLERNDSTQKWEEKKSQNTGQANKLSQLPQAMAQLKQLKVLVCVGDWNDRWAISDIGVLQSLTQLTTLVLSNNQISDIGVLQSLTQLTHLYLSYTKISDIGVLQSLTQLTNLYLNNNQISDIGVLQSLPQLTNLDLWGNQISDIGVLQSLTQLNNLDLSNNPISDIGVLQSLTQLTNLDLWGNQISDIGALQSLTQLTTLDLSGNQISDIGALQSLTQLTNLALSRNQISDIGALQSLTQLTTLDLSNNPISDIGALQSLTQLTTLDLSGNQISDIGVLQSLTQLTTLGLSYTKISDIGVLQSLTQLTKLDLSDNQISDIGVLQSLTQLTTLNLSGNQISDIGVLQSLTQLTTLNLSGNQISDIGVLQSLTQLTKLDLWSNQITDIGVLQSLNQLTDLQLWGNQISDIGVLQSLTQLNNLDLSGNQISDIGVLQSLTQLTKLDLRSNQISDIGVLQSLNQLTTLALSDNQISDIGALQSLTQLTLDLSHNQINDIGVLQSLTQLTTLYLSDNKISDFGVLQSLTQLTTLDLSHNQINDIGVLQSLNQLTDLNLSNNPISDFGVLQSLTQLTNLNLSGNKISDIGVLQSLTQLTDLDLSNNPISDFGVLQSLTQLTNLNLSGNQISDIGVLQSLTQLTDLNLSNNEISDLSPLLGHYKKGVYIDVANNPITTPPIEIVKQGTAVVLSYLKDLAKGASGNKEIKLIVVGNGCVGKTALVRRLLHNTYEHIDVATGRTHGIIIAHYHLPDSDIDLHIWDFGGQEIYHATHRLFLSSNALYLLLWSNEPQVQPNEPHYEPVYWLDYIAELSNNNRVLLVPSKQDKYGDYALPNFTELQAIYKGKGLQLFQLNAISALNGTNIRTLRTQLTDLAEQLLQQHTQQLPNNWIAVRQCVYEQWIGKRQIATLADFTDLCHHLDLDNETTVLRYLSDSGVLFWRADTLQNDIIVDQQYFLDIIYEVFKDRHVKKEGIFTWADACDIWISHKNGYGYSDNDRHLFLHFMSSCEIMFYTQTEQGETEYVIPQLLPNTPTATWLNKPNEKQLRLTYPFLHRNIIERFIIRTAQFAKQAKSWWRNGIYLADEQGNEAYIQATNEQQDNRNQSIVVKVCGNNDLQLLAKIRNEFAQLSRFEQVKQEVSLDAGNTWVDVSHIKQQYERGEDYIYDKNNKVPISPYLAFLNTETTLSSSSRPNIKQTMTHKQHLQQLIAQGKLKQAIEELLAATQQNGQSDLHNNTIQLSGRFNQNEKDRDAGVINDANYNLALNQIRQALLSYLNEYQPNGSFVFTPQGTANNQNTTQGNGNIVIQGVQDSTITVGTEKQTTPPKATPKTILFLAANPSNASRLQTDKEYRIIKAELERGTHRDNYQFLLPQLSLTITELLRALNDKPNIVHFSGHGTTQGIAIVKDDNTHQIIPTESLKRLFRNAKDSTQLVLLNACYSAEQAKVISEFGMYVIGNNLPIGDDAAISFAKGLYNGLSEGKTIEQAYNDAIIVLGTENPAYVEVVEVWKDGNKLDW